MKINANEIKVGMLIEYKDDLWEILKTQHVKPGKGGAFCQVEMKSINKNTKLNERFRSNDTIEKASIENIEFNYLYDDEINYYFINHNKDIGLTSIINFDLALLFLKWILFIAFL